jgi:hypothetical protein
MKGLSGRFQAGLSRGVIAIVAVAVAVAASAGTVLTDPGGWFPGERQPVAVQQLVWFGESSARRRRRHAP